MEQVLVWCFCTPVMVIMNTAYTKSTKDEKYTGKAVASTMSGTRDVVDFLSFEVQICK